MTRGTLTPKEIEALALIAQGHDAKSAARELSVSSHTIYERLRRAREKLGAENSRAAARQLFGGTQTDNEKSLSEFLVLSDVQQIDAGLFSSRSHAIEDEVFGLETAAGSNSPPSIRAWTDHLPLRAPRQREVSASKIERLRLIGELSVRLAMAFVAICLAAMVLSTLLQRS